MVRVSDGPDMTSAVTMDIKKSKKINTKLSIFNNNKHFTVLDSDFLCFSGRGFHQQIKTDQCLR